jgi:hypothetical protein
MRKESLKPLHNKTGGQLGSLLSISGILAINLDERVSHCNDWQNKFQGRLLATRFSMYL